MPKRMKRFEPISRRDWLRYSGLALVGASASGWLPRLAAAGQAADGKARRHCILLWMNGGPSQLDTFDLKPDHPNGGPFKPIATSVAGLQISEHLPKLAALAEHLAIVRSVSTKEGDHGRASYLMRTGYRPGGPVEYPTLGSLLAKELDDAQSELPAFVSISPYAAFNPAAYGPGFLGPRSAPATVASRDDATGKPAEGDYARLGLDNLKLPTGVETGQAGERLRLWQALEDGYLAQRPGGSVRRTGWSMSGPAA